jgi:hypothetical protein
MAPLSPSEIAPGIVARIDTNLLRTMGGSLTNAQASADEDRAVTGVHDFLVVSADPASESYLALPLFPRSAPGSAPLDPALQAGPEEWRGPAVFYSRWQHWQIPGAALAAASESEPSEASERRTYASGNKDALQDLANWATRNRCAFRPA